MTYKPPLWGDGTPPPRRPRLWWRFALAAIIIVGVSAAATSSSILLYIDSIARAIGTKENKHLSSEVASVIDKVHGGEPETLAIFGSDERADLPEEYGRSDTTILVRLDSEQNLISVLSVPRDLQVEIPGYETNKFNAAYSFGGPKLAVQVIKELTGLKINHVINVDFLGFVRAVDAVGCVYTDVDRRYYHSNLGLPPEDQYSEIDIEPGYQKLCGKKALEYVRYRHTDTDIVRSARQQNFLGQVRHQVAPTDLLTDGHGLVSTLARYTTSDITSGTTLITLLDLLYELRGAEVNQVHWPAELGPSFVYSNEDEIHHAVREFLGEAGYDADRHGVSKKQSKKGETPKKKQGKKRKKMSDRGGSPGGQVEPGADELVPSPETGEAEGRLVADQIGGGFPVFYPTLLPPGTVYQEEDPYEDVVNPRVYHLKDTDKARHAAYRMVAVYQPAYELNYFGVQGIRDWKDPPILDDPTETTTVHGREYSIYTDSGKIKIVAWHRGENTYWISNSLQQSLTNRQMMGIAESCELILPKKPAGKGHGHH